MKLLEEIRLNPDFFSKLFILIFRSSQRSKGTPVIHFLMRIAYKATCFAYKVDIPLSTRIGPGLQIHHPFCIAIHPDVIIGKNCIIRHGTTIGNTGKNCASVPNIGDNVEFGCFSVVVGNIAVPDGTKIRALSTYKEFR